MSFLRNPDVPRLPDDWTEDGDAFRELLRILRLFFKQLDARLAALGGRNGMRFLEGPTASYFNGVDQVLVASTATPVEFPLFTNEQAFSKLSASVIQAQHEGTYGVRVSLSVRNTDAATQTLSAWLRKTGTDIPTSRADVTLPAGAVLPLMLDYIMDLLPTDTLEIIAFSTSANVLLYAPPVAGAVPRGAAARINIVLVSSDSSAHLPSGLKREKAIFSPPP